MEPSHVVAAALGALGTLVVGLARAMTDNKRTRSDDRTVFTSQVIARLESVEKQRTEEKHYFESQLIHMQENHQRELAIRDEIIASLRERVEQLELCHARENGSPNPRF